MSRSIFKDYSAPMTEAAYRREEIRLHAQASRNHGIWQMWNSRSHQAGFSNWDALDAAWSRSVDSGNAIVHFYETASTRSLARPAA